MQTHQDKLAVEAIELTKKFGDFTAVNRVTFHIEEGEIFGFLGPNGAGKTTVIRMLCGILLPTSGTGRVLGFDVARDPERIKERIGYMSQRFALYEDLTAWENLDFYAGLYRVPTDERRARIEELIRMADLVGREHELAANLSGGWKQRLALGCAIVHRPPMLFLDEPTSGVDPVSRRNFWDMIYALAGQGVTIFVTTHYMDEAEHCNTLGLMHDGRLIACDSPDELKSTRMQGELLEIDCHPAMDGLEILAALPQVREVALYGLFLHVVIDSAAMAMPVIESALRAQGVQVNRIERIAPSLEDVFVSMIDAESRARVRTEFAAQNVAK
jgi:ABC-2 type transport system ATP-binding protein